MMASALSEDEFHRMQIQLLELRTDNYQITDQCKRQEREFHLLRSQYEATDRELQKALKAISKSKKAREVDLLEQENEGLQRKLHSQEEEFRLQNETLMTELGQVIKANENFEKELELLKCSGAKPDSPEKSDYLDETRRLQALNSALQKNLTSCQEKYERQVLGLRQTVTDLEAQCVKLSGQRGTPVGEGSSEARTVEGQDDTEMVKQGQADGEEAPEDADSVDLSATTQVDDVILTSGADKSSLYTQLEEQTRLLNDLHLNLDTEREEKAILKEQMVQSDNQYKERIKSLQEEVDKITEKFKKKQDCLVHLQEEKELIYTELRNRIHEVEETKNTEIHNLKDQSNKLQQELTQCNQVLGDYEVKSNDRIQELEVIINSLESRVSDASEENVVQLEEQNSSFQQQLSSLHKQRDDLKNVKSDLEAQLKESRVAHQLAVEELQAAQQERDKHIQALQESHRVAEKRKSLLDELAIKYQEEADQHRETLRSTEEAHRAEVDLLTDQLDEARSKLSELENIKEMADKLQGQLTSVENTKGWLQRQLQETEDSFNKTKHDHEISMTQQEEQYHADLDSVKNQHQQQVQELGSEVDDLKTEIVTRDDQIKALQQDIKDGINDKKIHEKKGTTMLKDLKRQLHQERKRGEKLQERLQEYLADNRSRQSVEELFRPMDPNDRYKGDASSVSSWNASILSRENTLATSPDEELHSVSLAQENADLLKRIADIQQVKWMLEEKVSHLESSNSCMAEDLLQKTAVIEHYVMDSRTDSGAQSPSSDKMTLKRMVDMIKDRGDDNLRDMNKKLQNMLEETLTKNMHLQKDMETLSQEIVRLSKEAVTNSPAHAPPGGQSSS